LANSIALSMSRFCEPLSPPHNKITICFAALREIHPIARSEVYPHFDDLLRNLPGISKVSVQLQQEQPTDNMSDTLLVAQSVEPIDEELGSVYREHRQ
jgi:hypothetical protein